MESFAEMGEDNKKGKDPVIQRWYKSRSKHIS